MWLRNSLTSGGGLVVDWWWTLGLTLAEKRLSHTQRRTWWDPVHGLTHVELLCSLQ